MLFFKTLWLAILLNCSITVQTAKRRFTLEIYNFTCLDPAKRMLQNECDYTKLATNHFVFSKRFMFDRDLDREVDVRVLVQVVPQNGKKIIKFIDFKINLCDGLAQTMQNPLIKSLVDEMRRTGNMPYACPLKADFLYKLENYSVTYKTFPSYTPYLNFTFSLMTYEKDQLISSAILKGAVAP